jgi:sensor histidine kinase YesM
VKSSPFIAREAFYWLTLAAPAIIVMSNWGDGPASVGRIAGCMLSTWICAIVTGLLFHTAINAIAPRLLARTSRPVAIVGIAVTGGAVVTGSVLALVPRLVWLDPNLARSPVLFVIQGLVVATVYVTVGRLYTWLSQREETARERARETEARAIRARLAALQAQVNPHFLFNTLNAVASLIPTEPSSAEATLERLAGVLQYSIASGSRSSVTLGEELGAVRDYLEIEQARFGPRLRSAIDVDRELEQTSIPPMLLQPLVENAVLHGLASKPLGGAIKVEGRAEDDAMVLRVSDDGVGPGGSTRRGNQTGLDNLRERLALIYGASARLSVRAREGGGFECEIRVPRPIPA